MRTRFKETAGMRLRAVIPAAAAVSAAVLLCAFLFATGYSSYTHGFSLIYFADPDAAREDAGGLITRVAEGDLAEIPGIKQAMDVALEMNLPLREYGSAVRDDRLYGFKASRNRVTDDIHVYALLPPADMPRYEKWISGNLKSGYLEYGGKIFQLDSGLLELRTKTLLDEITRGDATDLAASIASSLAFWLALSWRSGRYGLPGVTLPIITGASLALPFLGVLTPVAGMIVGAVAGFSASRLQRRMDDPSQGRPLKVALAALVAAYLGLVAISLASHSPPLWEGGFSPWFSYGPLDESGSKALFTDYRELLMLLVSAFFLAATVLFVYARK